MIRSNQSRRDGWSITKFWLGGDYFENVGLDGRIILKF
jgi:hypothetical protein